MLALMAQKVQLLTPEEHAPPRQRHAPVTRAAGQTLSKFACFTSTKVQLLTPEERAAVTRSSPGLVHARVEVDAYRAHIRAEADAAQERWELMTVNEELRGLPMREYPHIPGEY
jgi:hypothetical protein